MAASTSDPLPSAWAVIADAIQRKQPVRAIYDSCPRILCPHALGWKDGRAKVISYQSGGTTSTGELPADPHQRWRCMFVDELADVEVVDSPWETGDNHSQPSNCFDAGGIEIEVAY